MNCVEDLSIEIHNKNENYPFDNIIGNNEHFGILKIKMAKTNITTIPLFILFTIDNTGSMGERDGNKQIKMDYVKQTFRNMMRYLSTLDVSIFICVHSFNVSVDVIIDTLEINTNIVDDIIRKIDALIPENCTNIELALTAANNRINDYKCDNPSHKVAHIFMTDGEATVGEKNNNFLFKLVNANYTNVFVGFGLGHNSILLRKLSEKKNADYQFVDNMENSSLVYGETLHKLLYPIAEDIEIKIDDGLIYDWQKNEWVNSIQEDIYVSEIEKIYHLKTDLPLDIRANIFGIPCNTNGEYKLLDFIIPLPPLMELNGSSMQIETYDLTKYMYRQKVQQVLFKAKSYLPQEFRELKMELASIFKKIRNYMRETDLLDDSFLKQLCDDIHIVYKTLGTRHGQMFSVARQRSQGRQQAYTTSSSINEIDDANTLAAITRPSLKRTMTTNNNFPEINRTVAFDELDDFMVSNNRNVFSPMFGLVDMNIPRQRLPSIDLTDELENDDDNIDSYIGDNNNISCYASPSAIRTMTDISQADGYSLNL
jgi:hypothetical protein